MTDRMLTRRELNRTLLQRQHLLARTAMPAATMVEYLAGMQAQNPGDPYHALWCRIDAFDPAELSELIASRQAVRIGLMRGTIHLVTARDCLALRPVLQPVMERVLFSSSPFGRALEGMDVGEVLAFGRQLVAEVPLSNAGMVPFIRERWPDRDAAALSQCIRYLLPMVQTPPRGLWGASGQAAHTTAENWLGRPLDEDSSPDGLVLRYLAAFGPATPADVQAWSGLTGMRAVLERLRPRLRTFRDERGRELFDIVDAPIADADLPAPVRLLPEYDNVFLGHADRARIVSEEDRKSGPADGRNWGPFLLDGFIAGGTRVDRDRKKRATMLVRFLRRPSKTDLTAVLDEGARLLRFLAPSLEHDLKVVE